MLDVVVAALFACVNPKLSADRCSQRTKVVVLSHPHEATVSLTVSDSVNWSGFYQLFMAWEKVLTNQHTDKPECNTAQSLFDLQTLWHQFLSWWSQQKQSWFASTDNWIDANAKAITTSIQRTWATEHTRLHHQQKAWFLGERRGYRAHLASWESLHLATVR